MDNKKGGDLICMRPDSIIEARFKLNKRQNDIMDMVFATIENDNKLRYEIDISKYGKLYNIKDKSNIYRDLKKAVKSFEGKGFAITQKISEKKENRIYFSWFSSIQYLDGESKIILELGQTLKEIMLSAKQACFYQIKYTLNFNNIYSKRIYYYLKSYENSNKNGTGWRIDNLDELRAKLECPKTYSRYADFKRFVLTPAYEEINGNSDISFEYKEIKTKNKVTALKFIIHSNSKKVTAIDEQILGQIDTEEVLNSENAATIDEEPTDNIKQVQEILSKHNISGLEAKKILSAANGDIELIKQRYDYFLKYVKKADNPVGLIISLIKNKELKKPQSYEAQKKNKFLNFPQTKYDFAEIEQLEMQRTLEELKKEGII